MTLFFTDLKVLEIRTVEFSHSFDMALPFHLTQLCLKGVSLPPEFLHAIARQTSLSKLSVSSLEGRSTEWVLEQLLPLAPRLTTLEVFSLVVNGVDAFLSKCTQLKHITMNPLALTAIQHLVSPLESWTITGFELHRIPLLLDVLKSDAVGLAELQVLELQVRYPLLEGVDPVLQLAREREEWFDVEEACRKRKVKLRAESPE